MTATTLIKETFTTMAFADWTTQVLEDTFNLARWDECAILNRWLEMDHEISEEVRLQLNSFKKELEIYAPYWNEMELRLYFIGPLLNLVNYKTSKYHAFAERTITAKKGEFILKGSVDFMVASGKYEPKQPFFFFHEYKKEKGTADDPIAQLLSAMLVGQALNQYKKPVYGAYVIGRNWFFVVIEQNHYCISNAFVASKDEILDIYRILVNLKGIIERELI